MFIKSLKIKNFRSIKHLDIEPSDLCAIIGPNSAGKTNILKAIDLILGEGWTTKAKVAKELFNDPDKPVEIAIELDESISFTGGKGYDVTVSSIELEMTLRPELHVQTTINRGDKFYDQEKFKKLCHFIYIPSERSLESELRVSQWTMLGKLMKLIYEAYLTNYDNDEVKLKDAFEKEINPAKEFLEKDFSNGSSLITFKKFSDVFKKYCLKNSAGLANGFEPVLNIYNINWFYKTLQIHVKEDLPDKHFESDEVGAGMQTLLMISIFQTYAELMGGRVIFGVEEPEIYLYPQAQRSLYKNFIELSNNTQIFYTTHNPNFVDAARPDNMLLLRKSTDKGTYKLEKNEYFNSTIAEKEKYKIYTHFNPERNEVFFARKVLLVEGDSDKILFTTLCEEKWNIDIDLLGVSIISCGGKSGVNYFIGVCNLIGLDDYFAVWDEDNDHFQPDKDFLPYTFAANKGLEIKENLEKFLKLSSNKDATKVKNAYEWAINIKTDDIPQEFRIIKDFIIEGYHPKSSNKVEVVTTNVIVETTEVDTEPNPDDIPF
jgi:predicted ATP-dependent endonuclease of OLD family